MIDGKIITYIYAVESWPILMIVKKGELCNYILVCTYVYALGYTARSQV